MYAEVSVEPLSRESVDTMATIDDLPKEIMMMIFSFLTTVASLETHDIDVSEPDWDQDFLSLCSAALVSREWRQLAEDPLLWKRFVLVINSSSDLAALNTTTRFSRIKTVMVRGAEEHQTNQLRQLLKCRHIETVFCTSLDFLRLAGKSDFLVRVTQLKHFITTGYYDTITDQDREKLEETLKITRLFKTIANSADEGNCKLLQLGLDTCPFKVDPIVLAKVVGSLERLDLASCELEEKGADTFVDAILESKSLKRLYLNTYFQAAHVEPMKLARALHKLEYIHVVVFNEDQFREIIKIFTGETEFNNPSATICTLNNPKWLWGTKDMISGHVDC